MSTVGADSPVAEDLEGVASAQGVASPVGVALFGMGRAGQYHLPRLAAAAGVAVRWVVDVAGGRDAALGLSERHGLHTAVFLPADHCQQAFDDPLTTAVVITTPTDYHADLIKRALRAGKHVFCEKPISFTSAVVRSCYEEAERCGRVLFCGFNKRFDEQHVFLRELLQSGQLGKPRLLLYNWRDPRADPATLDRYIGTSGGIFCDSAIHQLDFIPWMLGEKPRALVVTGERTCEHADVFTKMDDVDSTVITLLFPSGVQAVIEVTREGHAEDLYFRIEAVGTLGSYLTHKAGDHMLTLRAMDGQPVRTDPSDVTLWSSYGREMDCFLRVVRGQEECPVKPSEVIQASRLADLCLVSLKEGEVVTFTDH